MYQVIARKWRPQTFEDVTGQEPITRTLKNAVVYERVHHAYLFSGGRGVGKTTTARLFAKALNCHKSDKPTSNPCVAGDPDTCPSCREIAEGRSIDVLEIDAASNTGVDNVRDAIIGSVAISAARDRYKVFIIDEVHMLSGAAFNALLKTLEEPPPKVVFIMATTERHKLPDTILSRVQQFEFRTISTSRIAERLRHIATAEQISISDAALKEIARAGEGSMRDAQSAFDQVISFSGNKIEANDVEAALGLTGNEMLSRTINAIASGSSAEVLTIVGDLVTRGHDLRNFCRDLLARLRDLLVAQVAGGSSELLDSSVTDANDLKAEAGGFSEADLGRFFRSISETESVLKAATQPRYQLEVGLVRLIEMRRLAPLSEMLERLAVLENSIGLAQSGTNQSPPQQRIAPGKLPERRPQESRPVITRSAERAAPREFPGSSALNKSTSKEREMDVTGAFDGAGSPTGLAAARAPVSEPLASNESPTSVPTLAGSDHSRILAALGARNMGLLHATLEGATKSVVEGDEIYIEFSPGNKHLRDTLARPDNLKVLNEVCREIHGRDIVVRFAILEPGASTDGPVSAIEVERQERIRLREAAEKDPSVQQILKTFRGEIVDVRKLQE